MPIMLRSQHGLGRLRCALLRAASPCSVVRGMSTSSSHTAGPVARTSVSTQSSFEDRVRAFCADMQHNKGVLWEGVLVCPDETQCRGLVADCAFGAGTTVVSVPLQHASLSATQLLGTCSPRSPASMRQPPPPPIDVVCRVMSAYSIHDPVVYEQVYLALLIAAERMNPNSVYRTYFDILPHPAIDDSAVIAQYKSVIDPNCLVLWDDFQRQFLTILRMLRRRWVGYVPASESGVEKERHSALNSSCTSNDKSDCDRCKVPNQVGCAEDGALTSLVPPIEVMYWALRTVLARMYMLPNEGRAPSEVGSTLPYTALCSVDQADGQTRWMRRLWRVVCSLFVSPLSSAASYASYRLVPTLVPMLDMVPHVPSSNVCVDVVSRRGRGSCVELQALRDIHKGETIGIRFATAHDPAFLLYRFGFIPQ